MAPSGYNLAPQVFISGGGGMYVPAPGAEAASTFDVGNFVPATGMMVSGGGKMYMPSAAAVPMGTSTGMASTAPTASIASPAGNPTASSSSEMIPSPAENPTASTSAGMIADPAAKKSSSKKSKSSSKKS